MSSGPGRPPPLATAHLSPRPFLLPAAEPTEGDGQNLPKAGRRAARPARPGRQRASRDVTPEFPRRHAPFPPGRGAVAERVGWWDGFGEELPEGPKEPGGLPQPSWSSRENSPPVGNLTASPSLGWEKVSPDCSVTAARFVAGLSCTTPRDERRDVVGWIGSSLVSAL